MKANCHFILWLTNLLLVSACCFVPSLTLADAAPASASPVAGGQAGKPAPKATPMKYESAQVWRDQQTIHQCVQLARIFGTHDDPQDSEDGAAVATGTDEKCPVDAPADTSCNHMTIRCIDGSDPSLAAVGGRCESQSCNIILTDHACQLLGFKNNQTLCKCCFWAKLDNLHPTSLEQIEYVCLAEHEGQHAIDGLLTPDCEAERRGHVRQRECLIKWYRRACQSANTALDSYQCMILQADNCLFDAAVDLQMCRCEPSAPPEGQPCPTCVNRCTDNAMGCMRSAEPPIAPFIRDRFSEQAIKGVCQSLETAYCLDSDSGACCTHEDPGAPYYCADHQRMEDCRAVPGGSYYFGKKCSEVSVCEDVGACCSAGGRCIDGLREMLCSASPPPYRWFPLRRCSQISCG